MAVEADTAVHPGICASPLSFDLPSKPLSPAAERALVFPGQGSQQVGMGRDLAESFPAARAVFEEIDDALGMRLSQLMFDGPREDLIQTENAQPALMAVGAAVMQTLRVEFGLAVDELAAFVAGHSLGEYTALVAAGSLTITDAARVLRRRGLAMRTATPHGVGGMATVIGLDVAAVRDVARAAAMQSPENEICVIANDNAPRQVVISGTRTALERASELAMQHGARKVVKLAVSGPFHCPLMETAAWEVAAALAEVPIRPPIVPLINNVTARETTAAAAIREGLVAQMTGMVRWREVGRYLLSRGVTELLEFGPGTVLSGLAKRIDRRLTGTAVNTARAFRELVARL